MPVVNVRLASGSASPEQKKEVIEGVKDVLHKVLNKDKNWIHVELDEAPLNELIEIIEKARK
ncbi:tautomerase [Acetobacteraceae bacterium]|nr:tautomerase [Acetobacteraceae bacterium]